jgi:hypothetical protein
VLKLKSLNSSFLISLKNRVLNVSDFLFVVVFRSQLLNFKKGMRIVLYCSLLFVVSAFLFISCNKEPLSLVTTNSNDTVTYKWLDSTYAYHTYWVDSAGKYHEYQYDTTVAISGSFTIQKVTDSLGQHLDAFGGIYLKDTTNSNTYSFHSGMKNYDWCYIKLSADTLRFVGILQQQTSQYTYTKTAIKQ